MVQHRNLANLIYWHLGNFALREGEHSSSVAGFGFDASTWEILPVLSAGAALVLPSTGESRDPETLLAWWNKQALVTSFLSTPIAELALAQGLIKQHLRTLLIGGDRLRHLPRNPLPFPLINNYGPTETTVVATSGRLESSAAILSIGRPISNTRVYILDAHGEPVPVGVAGELYIGGAGVARGYLNRPELTAERFLKDPFTDEPGARMYRTGDLGRWLSDGNIEYLGRNDFQVKIRGFRIELGEIEARLMEHSAVREAVVVAREDTVGDKRLVAYYTSGEEQDTLGAEQLRSYLTAVLPEYMVPAAYVRLASLPLTPNGKLDRKALPAPEVDSYATRGYEAPQGEIEEKLAEIWAEVLKLDRVGRHDNFFSLGGHSLLAITLIERMRRTGFNVDVRSLFVSPTLAALAATVDADAVAIAVQVPVNLIPLPDEQTNYSSKVVVLSI
jgi:acyl-coenzyme A synthetase/AMP-(fatty) acid ligase/aryl carrier-like protein